MKNSEFKLKKLEETNSDPKAIEVRLLSNFLVGNIYCDQEFAPASGVSLYPSELKSILTIAENFQLFYNNL